MIRLITYWVTTTVIVAVTATAVVTVPPTLSEYVPAHGLADHEHPFYEPDHLDVSVSLLSCCDLIQHRLGKQYGISLKLQHQLIQCVNESAITYQRKVNANIPYTHSPKQEGPNLNIALVTRATENVYDYAAYSYFLQAVYAQHNHYISLPLYPDSSKVDYHRYRKIVPLLEAMTLHAADADYVAWLDADLVVLDISLRLEQVAAQYPSAHLVVSADVSSLANSGFMLIRNSPFAVRLLERWLLNHKVSSSYADQSGFEHLYHSQLSAREREKIAIIRPDALNSEAPAMGRQGSHNQVLHLAAEGGDMRARVFETGMREVCGALKERRRPDHQLKMTREAMREVAELSYRAQSSTVFQQLNGTRYEEGGEEKLLQRVNQLRQDASKYVYTLYVKNGEEDTPEVFQVRRDAIAVMTAIIDSVVAFLSQHLTNTVGGNKNIMHESRTKTSLLTLAKAKQLPDSPLPRLPAFTLLLNLVKLRAEMVYELVMSLQSNIMDSDITSSTPSSPSMEEWEKSVELIADSLDFLQKSVGSGQQHMILDMQASFFGSTGEMLLALGQTDEAVRMLRESLSIYQEIASGGLSGDTRSQSAAASALGQALCMTDRQTEGLALLQDVISTEQTSQGPHHYRLCSKYLQAASCALQAGKPSVARLHVTAAEETMRRNPHVPFSDYDRESLQYFLQALSKTDSEL